MKRKGVLTIGGILLSTTVGGFLFALATGVAWGTPAMGDCLGGGLMFGAWACVILYFWFDFDFDK